MKWINDDGGRAQAGFKGKTGDCAVRAIAIVAGLAYRKVYDDINCLAQRERITKRKLKRSNARTGVHRKTVDAYMESLGFTWVPTMKIGQGCTVHLRPDELPTGTLLVRVSRHFTAVINGMIHDTYDCSRNGTRCVYGYYRKG